MIKAKALEEYGDETPEKTESGEILSDKWDNSLPIRNSPLGFL